MRSYIKQT